MIAPRRVLAVLGLGNRQTRRARFGEGVVAALVKRDLLGLEMQDRPDRAVQKPPVVADDQHRVRILGKVAFKPKSPFEVQIVGRLVQKQQIGLGKKHGRQRHAHPPAAGKIRTGPGMVGIIEPQTLQDRGRAPLGAPGVDVSQARLNLGDPRRVHGLFRQKRGTFGIGGQHGIEQ